MGWIVGKKMESCRLEYSLKSRGREGFCRTRWGGSVFRGEEGLGAPLNAIVIFSNRGRDNEGESIGNNMGNNSTEDPSFNIRRLVLQKIVPAPLASVPDYSWIWLSTGTLAQNLRTLD